MALSLEEMSDRFEIQDMLYHYADIIDRQAAEELSDIFTADAHIDYSAFGGTIGDLPSTIAFLKEALPAFSATQHLNANIQITVSGDTGTGRVMCFNPMAMPLGDETQVFMLGLWYVDTYRRTDTGWRISSRKEEKSWVFNVPDFMVL
ncbi:3-phenylpropionate/cinnamic acid dioxygenase small subunit [Zhongshania antarctica]|uniref:3-phenylpropionate/cinnamic acid dioxygenase small subunit n=1 Tax=Zhongshania antarctica TaxID=641702 RepID=A0A840R527_9GAMM|nr:nuclear transport factor 2 family protein [Zhongshania antarctica]MBB5188349.1 3-phenylpropionate/cinnamic acid dioxygenase small subunit [Zhongshania antarctica]